MPSLRESVSRFLFKESAERLDQANSILRELIEKRPIWINDLSEMDSEYMDSLVRHANDIQLGGSPWGYQYQPTESDRVATVWQSRYYQCNDVITQRICSLWLDYGLGLRLEISVRPPETEEEPDAASPVSEAQTKETAQDVFSEFWNAKRNAPILKERSLHLLGDTLFTDGEVFLAFFTSMKDGTVTVRRVATEQITEILASPDDPDLPLFYRRDWMAEGSSETRTLYYPDYAADPKTLDDYTLPAGAKRADEEKDGTHVCLMQIAYRIINGRGWPILTASFPWIKAYKGFLQDRAAVAKLVATYVDKLKVKGGSRGVDAIKQQLQSALTNISTASETNPVHAAGSTWVENEAVSRERMPQNTGAGDASTDSAALLGQAGLGGGLFVHYLGRGESFRLATATALEEPMRRQFQRYREHWAGVWRDIVNFVLDMNEKYGGGSFPLDERQIEVSTDALVEVDISKYSAALVALSNASLLPPDIGKRLALQALNVPDYEEVLAQEEPSTPAPAQPAPDETPAAPGVDEQKPPVTAELAQTLAMIGDLLIEAKGDAATAEEREAADMAAEAARELEEIGTASSGNWGHAGVKGQHGGSAPKTGAGAAMSLKTGKTAADRQTLSAATGIRGAEGKIKDAILETTNRANPDAVMNLINNELLPRACYEL